MATLKERVKEAIKNARENGYTSFIVGSDPQIVALDLVDKCSDLEDEEVEEVAKAVAEIQHEGAVSMLAAIESVNKTLH
jgi:hypothetical protein